MGDVFVWRLFHERVIRRAVWGEPPDEARVARTLAEDVPAVLDYLEGQLPREGFCFGAFSIADAALGAFFRNAAFARVPVDAARWPRTAGFARRVHASPPFARLAPIEDRLLRTPMPEHRAALAALGVPLTAESYGSGAPRRGVMPL